MFANGYDSVIVIENTAAKESFFSITVSEKMMDDIVLAYWKKNVVVEARKSGKGKMTLEGIRLGV